MLKSNVLETIKEDNLVKKGDKIILGISGGPDSTCLFNILNSIKKELNIKFILAHVNYNYRGNDSKLDEQFVKNLAKKNKIRVYCKNIQPEKYEKRNLEEYFREIRYEYFQEIQKKEKANKIAIAHNKDDQIETIIMHFLRGSGLQGLSGMDIKNKKIIRPLLNIKKKDILSYLKKNKIKYREDKTNKNTKFTRNKIRHKLIPYLEKEFNPNLKNTLHQSSKIIKNDQELLNNLTKSNFKNLVEIKKNVFFIDLNKFKKLHISLKRRLLQYIVFEKFKEEISASSINEILEIFKKTKTGLKKYLKEIEIIKNYDRIVIRKKKNSINFKKTKLITEGEVEIKELNQKFIIKKVDRPRIISKNECYIDLNKTGEKLFLRTRKKGDKFYPTGMKGSQKLKDYFINNKINQDKRDFIPLIVNYKDEIIWVAGHRADRRFIAKKNSKNILEIKNI